MKLSESQFVRERCLRVIRKPSMHESSWEMTLLDCCHAPVASLIQLRDDEYPLISFYAGDGDWTLYTTHRLIGECASKRTEIERSEFGSIDFGDFKQDLDSPRVTEATIKYRDGSCVFLYESGYASMAPIYYFRFWSIKWSVLKESYHIGYEEAEQDMRGNADPHLT